MKSILFLICCICFFSCGSEKNSEENIPSNKMSYSEKKELNFDDIAEKTFETGSKSNFTDSCSFYFECDCCFGDITFNNDSTFYTNDPCVESESAAYGTYSIAGNILNITYTGPVVTRSYNYAHETDSLADEFVYEDTLISAKIYQYKAHLCGGKLLLIEQNGEEFALITETAYDTSIKYLNEKTFINRLKKINQKITNN